MNRRFKDDGHSGTGGGRLLISPSETTEGIARSDVRRQMRRRRRALTAREREDLGWRVAEGLRRLGLYQRSRHVALYLPNDGEVDLTALLADARGRGKRFYLPVLGLPYENRLWFMPFDEGSALVRNRFGIPEPASRRRDRARKPCAVDLVLAPLVAFDADGHRLGMGGGFYDRSLARLHHLRHWRTPRLVGVAYEFQRVPRLPAQPWDVPLDAVVTEAGVHGQPT